MFDELSRQQQPFILDRYGVSQRVMVPHYRTINEIPMPCARNQQGMITSLMCCFNCGSKDHNLRDCKIKRDRACIQMNRSWMQEYARIGVKKSRGPDMRTRYFDKNQSDLEPHQSFSKYKKPSQTETDSYEKPPDLQIVTEDMEWLPYLARKNNKLKNIKYSDQSSRKNNWQQHNVRENNYNERDERSYSNRLQNNQRRPDGWNDDHVQQRTSRSWLFEGSGSSPRPRIYTSRRTHNPYQAVSNTHQPGRWRGEREMRKRN